MVKKVSIVICTYNRAEFLDRTLKSLDNLRYNNFEVIVVNGPSTDNTQEVIDRYSKTIKHANNSKTNLSISRNIGIKLSSGDIVAFIDDDAIPDEYWLDDLIEKYDEINDDIGGVGGKVYGPGGNHFQFANGCIDLYGNIVAKSDNEQNYNDPNGDTFNIMMGTNCSFLRKALIEVGGFDEFYEYFHDESDLCVRIIKAGYKIKHHQRAYVYHEFARSHIRNETRNPYKLNWYPIIKNEAYFILKNAIESDNDKKLSWAKNATQKRLVAFKTWLKEGKITRKEFNQYMEMGKCGIDDGIEAGLNSDRLLNFNLESSENFIKFDSNVIQKTMNICLLCQDDVFSEVGGIAKYTYELAKGYVRNGNQVHIITKSNVTNNFMKEGINVHEIVQEDIISIPELNPFPTAYGLIKYSYCVYRTVLRLHKEYHLDIIESPLWNFEGLVSAFMLNDSIPIVTRLQTPLKVAVETNKWEFNEDLQLFCDFEKALLEHSKGIISISDSIRKTIEEKYDVNFTDKLIEKVYLGIDDPNYVEAEKSKDIIRILFVGRLERRKGIHTLHSVIPTIMNKFNNVEFVFVGRDDISDSILGKSFKQKFHEKYSNEKWINKIHFLGEIDNVKKNEEYKKCDLLVAPSLYESFGLILVEAMSYGKPVIASNIGGMKEIVKNEQNGYLINPENEQQLTGALLELINAKEIRIEFGKKSKEIFNCNFTNNIMISKSLNLYKNLINSMKDTNELQVHNINLPKDCNINFKNFRNYNIENIFIHIGIPKTGSSSIELTLYKNYDYLKNIGYITTKPLGTRINEQMASLFMNNPEILLHHKRNNYSSNDILEYNENNVRLLLEEIYNSKNKNLILVNDVFSIFTLDMIYALKDFLLYIMPNAKFNISAFVRERGSYISSYSQERIKNGDSRELLNEIKYRNLYRNHLRNFNQAFRKFSVFRFEDIVLHKHGLVGFFLDNIGIKEEYLEQINYYKDNAGISNKSAELILYINEKVPNLINNKANSLKTINDIILLSKIKGEKYFENFNRIKNELKIGTEDSKWLFDNFGIEYTTIKNTDYLNCEQIIYDEQYYKDIINIYNELSDYIQTIVCNFVKDKLSNDLDTVSKTTLTKLFSHLKM